MASILDKSFQKLVLIFYNGFDLIGYNGFDIIWIKHRSSASPTAEKLLT